MRFEFLYHTGRFGIPTPRRIVLTSYGRLRRGAGGAPELAMAGRVALEYSDFKRFTVLAPKPELSPQEDKRK
jgi:hypothetical protein